MQENRLNELDALRAWAFIFVIAQHILGGYAWRPGMVFHDSIVLNLLYVIAKPAVPIFLALVGITILHSTRGRKLNIVKFYSKKVKFIVIPYIIWAVVIILLNNKLNKFDNILGVLITGDAEYHLWYMGTLLRIFLYFPIILPIINKLNKINSSLRPVLLILFCVFYWFLLKHNDIVTNNVAAFIFKNPSRLQLKFVSGSPLYWSIYFVLGLEISFNYDKFVKFITIHKAKILFLYSLLLPCAYYDEFRLHIKITESIFMQNVITYCGHIINITYMCVSVVVFYILSLYIYHKKEKLYGTLKYMAHYSYSGYLIHTIVLGETADLVTRFIPQNLVSGLIIFIITVYISIKLPHLLSYLPYSEYLIGTKRIKDGAKKNPVFSKSM